MRDFRTQLAIDKAANGDRVELLKRAALSPEDALRASIASGLADDDVKDKAAWIAEQTKAYNDHVGKRAVAFSKGATEMSAHDDLIVSIAKNVVSFGADPVFPKSAYITAIAKRSDVIKKPGESTQQVFSRAITHDEIGKLLYRASKSASGPEIEPDGTSGYPASTAKPPPWAGLGPAHAKLEVLARDHKLANERKSIEQARSYVYAHPDNVALREQCKAEHYAAINKVAAA
jgi:hypothetical protein